MRRPKYLRPEVKKRRWQPWSIGHILAVPTEEEPVAHSAPRVPPLFDHGPQTVDANKAEFSKRFASRWTPDEISSMRATIAEVITKVGRTVCSTSDE